MPVCRVCKEDRPQEKFYWRKDTQKYRTECRACQQDRQYHYNKTIGKAEVQRRQRKWRDRRFKIISRYKVMKGCIDCGYKEHPAALDFDHVRGTKIKNVALMLTHSWALLKKEIAKCDIVCANCHRVRHQENPL